MARWSNERLEYLAQRALDQEMSYTEWRDWLDAYRAISR